MSKTVKKSNRTILKYQLANQLELVNELLSNHTENTFSPKETIMISENEQTKVNNHEFDYNPVQQPNSAEYNAPPASPDKGSSLIPIGIGAIVGAVIGAATAALASKVTVESVNNSVKGVGDAVKGAAMGVNNTVKGVGDAVKNVAENVDYTLKDVGTTVKGTAEELNSNVKGTVNAVKGTAQNVNYTVKGTTEALKSATQEVKGTVEAVAQQAPVENQQASAGSPSQPQTAYVLVPVDNGKFMMQNVPIDGGMPAPKEVNIEPG